MKIITAKSTVLMTKYNVNVTFQMKYTLKEPMCSVYVTFFHCLYSTIKGVHPFTYSGFANTT